ncbi:MAG TPA: ABC transporter permease, partial [Alphaproteobacteria bacterium]|nr:ABC transporter permease [Alphaproteobacteria bacterium]
MSDPSTAFAAAWHLVATGDRELYAVVALSLRVSLS